MRISLLNGAVYINGVYTTMRYEGNINIKGESIGNFSVWIRSPGKEVIEIIKASSLETIPRSSIHVAIKLWASNNKNLLPGSIWDLDLK